MCVGCSAAHLGSISGHRPLSREPIHLACFPFTTANLSTLTALQLSMSKDDLSCQTRAPQWLCPCCFSGPGPWEPTDVSCCDRMESVLPCSLPCFPFSSLCLLSLFPFLLSGIVSSSSWILGNSCKDSIQMTYGAKGVKSKILQSVQGCTTCL